MKLYRLDLKTFIRDFIAEMLSEYLASANGKLCFHRAIFLHFIDSGPRDVSFARQFGYGYACIYASLFKFIYEATPYEDKRRWKNLRSYCTIRPPYRQENAFFCEKLIPEALDFLRIAGYTGRQ